MKHWKYKELNQAVYESYNEFLKAGKNPKEAYVRAGDEFLKSGDLEDAIVLLVLGEIMILNGEGSHNYIEAIKDKFISYDFDKAIAELSKDEFEDFQQRSNKVLMDLNEVKVDYP